MPHPIAPAAANPAAALQSHITMLRGQHRPLIPRLPLHTEQPRTPPLRTQPQVAAVDTQAAVVVDMTAADATKLLLHYWAAVCTTNGGAYQLRRFALAKAFQDASRPNGRRAEMIKIKVRVHASRDTETAHGRISFGLIGSDLIGSDLSGFKLFGGAFIGRFSSETGGQRAITAPARQLVLVPVLRTDAAAPKPAQLFSNRALRGARRTLYWIRRLLRGRGSNSLA